MSCPCYNYAILGDACTPHSMAILNNTKFLKPTNPVYNLYYTHMYREPISATNQYMKGLHPFINDVSFPEYTKAYDPGKISMNKLLKEQYNTSGGCTSCSSK